MGRVSISLLRSHDGVMIGHYYCTYISSTASAVLRRDEREARVACGEHPNKQERGECILLLRRDKPAMYPYVCGGDPAVRSRLPQRLCTNYCASHMYSTTLNQCCFCCALFCPRRLPLRTYHPHDIISYTSLLPYRSLLLLPRYRYYNRYRCRPTTSALYTPGAMYPLSTLTAATRPAAGVWTGRRQQQQQPLRPPRAVPRRAHRGRQPVQGAARPGERRGRPPAAGEGQASPRAPAGRRSELR